MFTVTCYKEKTTPGFDQNIKSAAPVLDRSRHPMLAETDREY